jgi:tetratricopeptide (TPR) repeat protein
MKISTMTIVVCLTLTLLAGCKSTFSYQQVSQKLIPALYIDDKFAGFEDIYIESEEEIFALDEDMKALVTRSLINERDSRKKARKLLRHFFDSEQVNLAYSAGANVIASEAYQNNEANCLSLTIMAYAIADAADLDVVFQSVNIPEYWVRNGRINMLTGHVNLKIIDKKSSSDIIFLDRSVAEIDFDPYVVKKTFSKKVISKNTVIAMFYSNKGANALVEGDYITAYAYLKAATKVDASFSSAWGNLGILYRFKGYEQQAINTYQYAINIDDDNLTAMSNLSMLLHNNGQFEQAKQLDAFIMRQRASNPYYYALLADEKFYIGAYNEAIPHYRKAIRLNKNIHEFYFGLAKTYYMLNDIEKSQSYMKKAIAKNRVNRLGEQYIAKLDILKQSKKGSLTGVN